MKVLIFDIWGDFGHFKKFYTTSSPLTFSFPPPPTIKGMLGAILGLDKREYLNIMADDRCKLGIGLVNPVKKVRMGLNHINTKGNFWTLVKKKNHEARTQIRTEFLKNPHYRIYFHHEDEELFNQLIQNVKEHKTFYTLSLGLSELLADFKFISVMEFKEAENSRIEVKSVIPIYSIKEGGVFVTEGKRYFKERIPIKMNQNREVEIYDDVIFEADGKPVEIFAKRFWEGENGECITFF